MTTDTAIPVDVLLQRMNTRDLEATINEAVREAFGAATDKDFGYYTAIVTAALAEKRRRLRQTFKVEN